MMKNLFFILLFVVSTASFSQVTTARSLSFVNDSSVDIELSTIETYYYLLCAIEMPYFIYGNGSIIIPPGERVVFMQTSNTVSFPFCCVVGCEYVPSNKWYSYSSPLLECHLVPQYGGTEFVYYRRSKYNYEIGGMRYHDMFEGFESPISSSCNLGIVSTGPNHQNHGPIRVSHTVIELAMVYSEVVTFM